MITSDITVQNAEVTIEENRMDNISRQAAINIAKDLLIKIAEYHQYNQAINNYCAELMKLPSAQSEQIPEHSVWFRISETLVDESNGHITPEQAIEKIRDYMYSMKIPPKGHWVKVSGFATPGGDPVWECSECGKGRHVHGIEHGSYGSDVSDGQWVSCPNCGADMRGEQNG